jgi:hypothetical protein
VEEEEEAEVQDLVRENVLVAAWDYMVKVVMVVLMAVVDLVAIKVVRAPAAAQETPLIPMQAMVQFV